jgi:hypothetical protein
LFQESELWKDIVTARYGVDVISKRLLGAIDSPRFASSWWRDLCLLDNDEHWFSSAVKMKVGRGDMTMFWDEHWVGEHPLRQAFPWLYGISDQKQGLIQDMGSMIDEVWHWDLRWRRNLFLWEEDQHRKFRAIIDVFVPSDTSDKWLWLGDGIQGFNVNSAYILLESAVQNSRRLEPVEDFVFKRLWKGAAPYKVHAFAWQLLLDRIQTKDNLFKRRMLQADQLMCVMCNRTIESANHLFLHCDLAHRVWYEIFKWLGVVIVMPPSIMSLFASFSEDAKNKRIKRGFRLVWHTVVWSLWRARNNVIFNNVNKVPLEIVEEIKVLSWRWSVDCLNISPCLFYEWTWDPGDCMGR